MAEREDFCDYPTGWRIQEEGGIEHNERCSSVPGHHPMAGPHFLCDCGAVQAEWERRVKAQRVCSCPDIDISDWSDRAANRRHTIKGRDPRCLEHGGGWIRE